MKLWRFYITWLTMEILIDHWKATLILLYVSLFDVHNRLCSEDNRDRKKKTLPNFNASIIFYTRGSTWYCLTDIKTSRRQENAESMSLRALPVCWEEERFFFYCVGRNERQNGCCGEETTKTGIHLVIGEWK